jgi:hypothetical protein
MPRYRQLHTKIVDSFDFNNMPDDFTRIFWVLLMVVADSEGRAIDNPAWLRSKMFPMREDVQLKKIADAIDWLAGKGMITRYLVDGNGYFFIPTWKEYQTGTDKEGKSYLPTPDLLRSNSGVTPDLLPLNTIQYNADSEAEAMQAPTPAHNLPWIYTSVTNQMTIPAKDMTMQNRILDALQIVQDKQGGPQAAVDYLKPYWKAWTERKTVDGTQFSKTNTTWLLEWAVAETIPVNKKEVAVQQKAASIPVIMRTEPDPTCQVCKGTGQYNNGKRWIKCNCVKERSNGQNKQTA